MGQSQRLPGVDFALEVVRLRISRPTWEMASIQALKDGFRLMGAVPTGVYMTGLQKGAPILPPKKWMDVHYVTNEEIERRKRKYEKTTGRCSECFGNGDYQVAIGIDGPKYAKCKKCDGKGVPNG